MATTTAGFPDIADYELYKDGIPYELFARMRRASPVWVEEPATTGFAGGPGYWFVGKHADVSFVTQNPQIFSSEVAGTTVRDITDLRTLAQIRLMMLNMDPPKHSKLRKIVNRAFTPQVVNQLRGSIEAHAREVIDSVAARGECDFLKDVAAEVPLLVLADVLGVAVEDRHLLHEWTDLLCAFDDPNSGIPMETLIGGIVKMFAYVSTKSQEKRVTPGNDVWSLVVNAEVDGEQLSKGQLERFFQLLMVAGNETTRNLIAHGMTLLSKYPEQRRRLQADMTLLPAAIEEMLRFAPPVLNFRRQVVQDVDLGGQRLKTGDKVLISYAAANRDETVFEDPDRFDITRNPNRHISFGGGTHFCLGSNLARLEARIVFDDLLTRLPDIEVSGPVERARSNFLNGLHHVPVRYTPARPRNVARGTRAPDVAAPGAPVAAPATSAAVRHGTRMLVLFGSNFGTAEDIARKIAGDAQGYGFVANTAPLDDYVGQLPTEGVLLIVTATYNGAPPDNATAFVKWLESGEESLAGVRYSVFGCGNSDWAATFQDVPRKVDQQMARRGAQRLHPQGEGDANGDFDGRFEGWYRPLWKSVAKTFSLELAEPVAEPLFSLEVLPAERVSPFVASLGARPMKLAVNRELRSSERPTAVGPSTRHVEFDLPDGVRYTAGDHLGVVPHNSDALVRRVASRFGFEHDVTIRLHAKSDRQTLLPLGERISLYSLLADYVELQDIAARSHLRTLAAHSECPFTKMNLEALAAGDDHPDGLYRTEVLAKRRSVIDLLEQFPACKLPFELYLEMLTPLAPRYYSISSSPLVAHRRCSITVGMLNGPARSGRGDYEGVCSNYIGRQPEGSVLYAFVKDTHSHFRLPEDPMTPIIMVGPGTGLAPFRGFLQERAAQKARGTPIGPSMTFFGCRHERQDYIYRDELEAFAEQGVTELHVAFSRMSPNSKVYVQDLIREHAARVWSLIGQGAIIYVCGDASKMEPDVKRTLTEIVARQGGMDAAAAPQFMSDLSRGNRYLVDVWASN